MELECTRCGEPFARDAHEVSFHVNEYGEQTDETFDLDADHVPY